MKDIQIEQGKIRKLFTLTKEEVNWLAKYKHENELPSENAVIRSLIQDKMNFKKKVIDKFFQDQENRKILRKLSDR